MIKKTTEELKTKEDSVRHSKSKQGKSMSTITKACLTNSVAIEMVLTPNQARELVDRFFIDLSVKLLGNRKVLFSSFGVFRRKSKKARIGINPQTGMAMTLPARTAITFSPTGNTRKAVNGGQAGRAPSAENLYPGTIKEEIMAKQAARIILSAIKGALVSGDRVEIRGFGSFSVRRYDGYTGRNPKTGEKTNVAPKKLPFFKPSRVLLRRANA